MDDNIENRENTIHQKNRASIAQELRAMGFLKIPTISFRRSCKFHGLHAADFFFEPLKLHTHIPDSVFGS